MEKKNAIMYLSESQHMTSLLEAITVLKPCLYVYRESSNLPIKPLEQTSTDPDWGGVWVDTQSYLHKS
jgi:hypothetical protein